MSSQLATRPQPNNVLEHPSAKRVRDDVPKMVITLEENAERKEQIKAYVREQMSKGTDYGTMPQGGKITLFKPGAEQLLGVFGFSTRTEVIHRVEDWDKNFVAYEVRVTVINKRTQEVEGDDVGSCNSKEKRYANQPAAGVANTILKMAKKRALVTATLIATRTSSLFQSEDFQDDEGGQQQNRPNRPQQPQRNQQTRPQQNAAPAPVAPVQASRELVANTERLRRLAVAEGFKAPNDAHLKPIAHSFTEAQCTTRFEQLKKWLKTNAPESFKDLNGGGKFKPTRDAQYTKCRSCNWPITFVASGSGGNMPVDADGVPHFMMCTKPQEHRKRDTERKPTPRPTAPAAPAKPAVPAHAAGLPKHVQHVWCVVGASALPPALKGRPRQERLDASNQILLDHGIDAVNSFKDLTVEGSHVLAAAIDSKLIVASPEGHWEVAS